MSLLTQELEKLARLHDSGALTDEEFAQAKATALSRKQDRPDTFEEQSSASLGNAANRYVTFQIGMTVVGLIVFVLVLVLVFLPRFNAFPRL